MNPQLEVKTIKSIANKLEFTPAELMALLHRFERLSSLELLKFSNIANAYLSQAVRRESHGGTVPDFQMQELTDSIHQAHHREFHPQYQRLRKQVRPGHKESEVTIDQRIVSACLRTGTPIEQIGCIISQGIHAQELRGIDPALAAQYVRSLVAQAKPQQTQPRQPLGNVAVLRPRPKRRQMAQQR